MASNPASASRSSISSSSSLPTRVEHRPLRRLGFALVKNAKVEQHVLPILRQAGCGERGAQGFAYRRPLRPLWALRPARRTGQGAAGRMPTSQSRNSSVEMQSIAVVILDLVKDLLIARLAPAFIGDDRTPCGLHLAIALAAVEGFHRLDGVVGLRTRSTRRAPRRKDRRTDARAADGRERPRQSRISWSAAAAP